VKNKFVQALVVMFKLEYPDEWPSFFSDLFMLLKSTGCTALFTLFHLRASAATTPSHGILNSPLFMAAATPAGLVMVDMFLRIMASIDQLVINSDAVRSSAEIAHASDIVPSSSLLAS
jgi:hypothetical protein